jgi:GTPase SAR1 family protein
MFYRDANVAFVCFESGTAEPLKAVSCWVDEVKKEVPDCNFIFVATKSDQIKAEDRPRVLEDCKRQLAELEPRDVHLTSAVDREGVDDLFKAAADLYLPRQQLVRMKGKVEARPVEEKGTCAC